jgi:hypothetical protein
VRTGSEAGWTLLPSGKILEVENSSIFDPNSFNLYDPVTGAWTAAGHTPSPLVNFGEIGPQVLRPDGTVFVAGGTGHTAIYNSKTGVWKTGPDFPVSVDGQLDVADGPGSLLPNGKVLVAASPGVFNAGTHFFEFDGRQLAEVASRPDAAANSSFNFVSLILPTGEILVNDTNDANGAMVYTSGGGYQDDWRPEIASVSSTLRAGSSYQLTGELLNGLSQGSFYGDDFQSATNYPLVRITNLATRHVVYARTHDHSSMAVAKRTASSTEVDIPSRIETGPSRLEVVTNGIPSRPVRVVISP